MNDPEEQHDPARAPSTSTKSGQDDDDAHSEHLDNQEQQAATKPFSGAREIVFVFTICMAQFLSLAGLAQSISPLPIIGRSFGVTDEGHLSWYPAAFSLTFGTFILPAGRLGDLFGHRNLCFVGYAWYAIWSAVAGVAVYDGDVLFSVARGFQGIGPALIVPNALALVGINYGASPRKNMVFALFGAAAPTGWVVGATFAAIFAQLAWWPWAYFAMAIASVAMILVNWVAVPEPKAAETPRLQDFDILGCVTGIGGLILFNFAWNQADVVGWKTPYTYALLIVGILLMAVFVFVEMRVAQPLVPIRGMTVDAALALGVIATGWGSFGIWVYYLWRLIENLRQHSPLVACAQNSPVAVSGLIAAVATGFLLSHMKVSYVLLIATLCFLTGQILIATAPVEQIYWAQTFVSIIVMPWGMDMSFPSATVLLSDNTSSDDQGIAASLVNTVLNYSISLGLGIAGTIVQQIETHNSDVLAGYRGAWYFGIGLDAIAVAIALYFAMKY